MGILLIAACMDIMKYKIPNWCMFPGIATGLFLTWQQQGGQGLLMTILQIIVIFAVFYPFYLLGGMGAGDVKLFMLLGSYLEKEQLITCIMVAMLLAGAGCVIKILFSKQCRKHLRDMFFYIRKIIMTGSVTDNMPVADKAATIRLAVPVLCSMLLFADVGKVWL